MTDASSSHNQTIVDQFTQQAIPFAQMHSDEESMSLLLSASEVTKSDRVLDVACGPGIVVCAFAAVAGHVKGIDITPAMIDQARRLQAEKNLTNVEWQVGDVGRLPFEDGEFSVVLSRYAFHHLMEPENVLREMVRVCRVGGRVVVADVFVTSPEQDATYNRMEKLRDRSHVRALGLEELSQAFSSAGVQVDRREFYRFPVEVDRLLQASCTGEAEAEEVRSIIRQDIGIDQLGISAHLSDGKLCMSFPVVIVAGSRI